MIEAAGPASERDGLGRGAGRACTGDGGLRVGVDRHSPERTPHIRRVERCRTDWRTPDRCPPTTRRSESAGRAGGVDAREAHRCRAPAALRFGATFSTRDHEPSPAKSIDAKSTKLRKCVRAHLPALRCQPAIDLISGRFRQPARPRAGNTCRWPEVADYRVRFRSALPQTRSAASEKSVMARATAARRFLGI